MKNEYKIFFAIPFDNLIVERYENVRRDLTNNFSNKGYKLVTIIGNKQVGPSQKYLDVISFRAQNTELQKQFFKDIADSDIIIADLTNNNPNVHIELGIALVLNKNIFRVTGRSVKELGFDIQNLEVHAYAGEKDLLSKIQGYLETFLMIKKLDFSSEYKDLYKKLDQLIVLPGTKEEVKENLLYWTSKINDPPFRDGAIKLKFKFLNNHNLDSWLGVYFRSSREFLSDSCLLYIRKNGSVELGIYPGPVIIDKRQLDDPNILEQEVNLLLEIENFHQQLILGIPVEAQKEFLKTKFSIQDYYSLLTYVVEDEEEEKTEIYAKLFQGLILNLIPPEIRLHLIKSVRELKYSDFDFMRKLYINEKYEFKAPGNKINQIKSLTISSDPLACYSIQTLIRLGFLYGADGAKPPWPTNLLKSLVEFLYDEDNLTPESLGQKAKTYETERLKIFFACDAPDISSSLLPKIGDCLVKNDIKYVIANPIRKSMPLIISPIIAICVGLKGSPINNLRKSIDLDRKTLIQILLPDAKKENLPLKDKEVFDFTQQNIQTEIDRLIKFINKQLEK